MKSRDVLNSRIYYLTWCHSDGSDVFTDGLYSPNYDPYVKFEISDPFWIPTHVTPKIRPISFSKIRNGTYISLQITGRFLQGKQQSFFLYHFKSKRLYRFCGDRFKRLKIKKRRMRAFIRKIESMRPYIIKNFSWDCSNKKWQNLSQI